MNAPPKSLPSKQELLSFQQSWMRRAGIAALFGAFVVAAAIIYQRAGLNLPDSNSDADQLAFAHAHSSRLILSSVIQAIGFALFAVPLYFLFRSAGGRAARVRSGLAILVVLGPLLFGVGVVVSAAGTADAANKFHSQEPAAVQGARQRAARAQASASAPGGKAGKSKGGQSKAGQQGSAATTPAPTTTTAPTTTRVTTTPSGATTTTTAAATPKTPDQAAHDAREGLADHINKHTSLLIVGGVVSTLGVLGLVFAMIYTSLWSMRVGLLTRFWGALGIAFGLFVIIPLFPPVPGLVLWFAAIGLMLMGTWPRPLPPAWAAGEAIPWPKPGEEARPPGQGPPGTVEGSGREKSEQPLPEGAQPEGPPEPPYGETQGQRRKKRKRRN